MSMNQWREMIAKTYAHIEHASPNEALEPARLERDNDHWLTED